MAGPRGFAWAATLAAACVAAACLAAPDSLGAAGLGLAVLVLLRARGRLHPVAFLLIALLGCVLGVLGRAR